MIKNPIDFGAIHCKLLENQYQNAQQFVNDIDLMLDNCASFNKPESYAAMSGIVFKKEFDRQVKALRFDFFL